MPALSGPGSISKPITARLIGTHQPFTANNSHMQQPSDQLQMFAETDFPDTSTLSPSDRLAKVSAMLDGTGALAMNGAGLSGTQLGSYLSADHVFLCGKMLREHSPHSIAQTFGPLCNALPTLGVIDLNGNCLTLSGYYPRIGSGYTLSDILQHPTEVSPRYFLSEKALQELMKGQQTPQLLELSP